MYYICMSVTSLLYDIMVIFRYTVSYLFPKNHLTIKKICLIIKLNWLLQVYLKFTNFILDLFENVSTFLGVWSDSFFKLNLSVEVQYCAEYLQSLKI